jgi:membrane protein implicated in regulation of membrane protease activity
LAAIVLAVFVLPAPWNGLVVVLGLLGEAGEMFLGIWYSRRRGSTSDTERMIGRTGRVIEPCRPNGQISFKGERWDAVCVEGADIGERVRIKAINGRRLELERIADR